jgi:hypothetical protein
MRLQHLCEFGRRNCCDGSAQHGVLYESPLLIDVFVSWKPCRSGTRLAGLQTGRRLLIQRCEGGGAKGDELSDVFGVDEKTFNRSGDLVAVAVLKTLNDSEMASPESVKSVLLILPMAFDCPHYCIKVTDDRRPRMTLLLLEHLNEITGGKTQTDIEEVKHFILQQASKANCQMEGIIYENGVPIRFCTKG